MRKRKLQLLPACVSENSSFCVRGVPGGKGWSLRLQAFVTIQAASANKLRDCFQSDTLLDEVYRPRTIFPAALSLKQTLCYV
jgi:hypothetical protein